MFYLVFLDFYFFHYFCYFDFVWLVIHILLIVGIHFLCLLLSRYILLKLVDLVGVCLYFIIVGFGLLKMFIESTQCFMNMLYLLDCWNLDRIIYWCRIVLGIFLSFLVLMFFYYFLHLCYIIVGLKMLWFRELLGLLLQLLILLEWRLYLFFSYDFRSYFFKNM